MTIEKLYLISEDLLERLFTNSDNYELLNQIRSHQLCDAQTDAYREGYTDGQIVGNDEGRRNTLNKLESEINRVSLTGFSKYTYRKWILEKLRQSKDGEP